MSVKVGTHLACVASVSVRFRNKEQGTRVKDRALVSFLARPKLKIPFLCLSLLSGHKYRKIKWIWICANRCGNKILLRKQRLQYTRNNFRWNGSRNMSPDLCTRSDLLPRRVAATCNLRGGSRIFFGRGCTRLLLYFNTNKPHSFFFCRIPVVLENRRSSRRGGGVRTPCTLPLDTPLNL